jgi:hypothetical protein
MSTKRVRAAARVWAAAVCTLLLLPLFAGAVAAATPAGVWSVGNASVVEGDSGTVQLTFTIHYERAAADSGNVRVFYDTEANTGTATGAANCNSGSPDYQHRSGNTTNTSSSTSFDIQISINVCGDLLPEGNETVYLTLSNPSGNSTISLTAGIGTGTIIDNDSLIATSTTLGSSLNPSVLSQSVTFTATVTGGSSPTGTVQFQIDGSNVGSPVALVGGQATYTTSALTAATHPVVAIYGGDTYNAGSTSNTVNQVVNATGPLDHIVISPKTFTTTAGVAVNYSAEAWDAYGNDLGDVTSSTSFGITSPGGCVLNACGSNTPGNFTVTGTYSGQSDTASLTVNAGGLHHIVISPATATIAAGGSQSYTAEAFDWVNNSLGDVTASTTFDYDGTACSGASCGPTTAGTYTVTGTYSGMTDTASLTVNAGGLHHIVISPATATIAAGGSQSYTAEAYDGYGNHWSVTASTDFDYDGTACSGASCGPTTAGTYTVTGTYSGMTDTASLTVNAGALDHIVISPATATITAGGSQSYTAEAYDGYGNHWSVTGSTAFDYDGTSCSGNSCTPAGPGTYTVTGTYSGMTDTASLTVNAGGLHHIVISPATATITAGGSQSYTAEAFDTGNNSLGDVTASTDFDYDGTACSGASCGPTTAGTYTVTGTYSGMTDTASLTVNAGALDHIVISPQNQTIDFGQSQAYSAEGFDVYGNSLGGVAASYTIDGDPCTGDSCTPTGTGAHTVVASFNGCTDSTTLTASPAAEDSASPSASASDDPGDPSESAPGESQAGTAPATGTSGSNGSNGTNPLFALLICAAFGGLALVVIEAQRRTIRL